MDPADLSDLAALADLADLADLSSGRSCPPETNKPRSCGAGFGVGFESGGVLLSRDLSSNYHRRNSVSLPCSGWERVVPLCHGHQTSGGVLREQGAWPVCLGAVSGR